MRNKILRETGDFSNFLFCILSASSGILEHMKKLWLQRAALFCLIFIITFVGFNYEYFSKNFGYYLHSPKAVIEQPLESTNKLEKTAEPNELKIVSLGIAAPVIYITGQDEKAFQEGLMNGVVHYPGTANPGELGNCYIFGHSSDYLWSKGKYKTVFALLPKISMGTDIEITNATGIIFHYTVMDSRMVAANDLSVLSQQGYKKKLLTLQTSYPVGTALKRWVVIAEDVSQ